MSAFTNMARMPAFSNMGWIAWAIELQVHWITLVIVIEYCQRKMMRAATAASEWVKWITWYTGSSSDELFFCCHRYLLIVYLSEQKSWQIIKWTGGEKSALIILWEGLIIVSPEQRAQSPVEVKPSARIRYLFLVLGKVIAYEAGSSCFQAWVVHCAKYNMRNASYAAPML